MAKAKTSKPRSRGVVHVLTEGEKVVAHMYLKHGSKIGAAEAARELGVDAGVIKSIVKSPAIQRYLQSYQHTFLREVARYELSQITKYAITREDIIGRLYMLALTPVEDTRGSLDGQVSAMNAIVDVLGLKFSPRDADAFFKGRTPEELDHFATHGRFPDGSSNDAKPQS